MGNVLRKVLIASFVVYIGFCVVVGVASLLWTGMITWTVKGFSVWNSAVDGLEYVSPWSLNIGDLQIGDNTFSFWLQNDGSSNITIAASGLGSGYSSAVWSSGGSYFVAIGSRVEATLTITVTGAGSYSFTFEVVT